MRRIEPGNKRTETQSCAFMRILLPLGRGFKGSVNLEVVPQLDFCNLIASTRSCCNQIDYDPRDRSQTGGLREGPLALIA